MTRFRRWKFATFIMLAMAAVLTLSACSSGVKSISVAQAKADGDFGLIVKAYKGGQFLLDGAILSSLDLSSHFAYLRDQHRLPKTILLERSDKSKIRRDHLRYMASMALTYGFTVYFDKGGKLHEIMPTASNKIKLRGSPNINKSNPEIDSHDAASGGMPGTGTGY